MEPAETRKQIIRVLTTYDEKDQLRLAAAKARTTVATYVREAALEKARKDNSESKEQ